MNKVKRKLLLVDDDPSLLATLGDFFRFEGYEVMCAVSGEDALIKMRPFSPDVIILDMGMPGMGGTGFLDRITNPDGGTLYPVLVLTARVSMAEYFADKQIAGFIAKPCDPADLLLEINRILFESAAGRSTQAGSCAPRRLVVADSDPELLQTLELEFRRIGFDVRVATRGTEALETAIAFQPDALIMRLELPGMSADEVVNMLQRLPNSKNIKVLVYGLDLMEVQLQHVANLELPQNRVIRDLSVEKIIDRTLAITGAQTKALS